MKPITFICKGTITLTPEEIASQILDVTKWLDFKGCWPIPGIKGAQFEVRSPEVVGSRIRVTNSDGSTHVEEIVEWQPSSRIKLQMKEFSAPLSRLAAQFEETWEFERAGNQTRAIRRFQLHPKSTLARPLLWMISFFLKRAIIRHLQQLSS